MHAFGWVATVIGLVMTLMMARGIPMRHPAEPKLGILRDLGICLIPLVIGCLILYFTQG